MSNSTFQSFPRRAIPSRKDLLRQCDSLIDSLSEKKSDKEEVVPKLKFFKLRKDTTMKFDGWSNESDALTYYNDRLPLSIRPDKAFLTRNKPDEEPVPKKRKLSPQTSQSESAIQPSSLPKAYYKPWPPHTHKLSFPTDDYYKIPETSAATLAAYMSKLQSDDSVELGLRITAHVNRDTTTLTIVPSPKPWHILKNSKFGRLNARSPDLHVTANDLRRRLSPHIRCNIGLTPGFSTMMLQDMHWYTLIVLGSEKLMQVVKRVLYSVSEQVSKDEEHTTSKNALMNMYEKAISSENLPDVSLVAMDSIGISLNQAAWSSLKKFLFICILESISIQIHTAGFEERTEAIYSLSEESQEFHIVCVSLQAVIQMLWPSRIQIIGPKQSDDRTCGAFGLATTWKMSSPLGLNSISSFIADKKANRSSGKRHPAAARAVPMLDFQRFYNNNYMHTVMRNFDSYIRSEIISKL